MFQHLRARRAACLAYCNIVVSVLNSNDPNNSFHVIFMRFNRCKVYLLFILECIVNHRIGLTRAPCFLTFSTDKNSFDSDYEFAPFVKRFHPFKRAWG